MFRSMLLIVHFQTELVSRVQKNAVVFKSPTRIRVFPANSQKVASPRYNGRTGNAHYLSYMQPHTFIDGPRRLPPLVYILAFFSGDRAFVPSLIIGYISHAALTETAWSERTWIWVGIATVVALIHLASIMRKLFVLSTGTLTRSGSSVQSKQNPHGTYTHFASTTYDDAQGDTHTQRQTYWLKSSAQWVADDTTVAYRKTRPQHAIRLRETFLPLFVSPQGEVRWDFKNTLWVLARFLAPCVVAICLVVFVVWLDTTRSQAHWPDGTPVYQSAS